MSEAATRFYVTGGTLQRDAPSYVERKADADLYDGLTRGEYCYVLTARQMGKSSLMVRAAARLQQEGVAVVVLDLTALGQNVTVEQWYEGLLGMVGRQLDLEDELEDHWLEHERLSPLRRWMAALQEVVLKADGRRQTVDGSPTNTGPAEAVDAAETTVYRLPTTVSKLVIFIDEIDAVRSLPFSTDEFFASIRECYNRRSQDPEFQRLTFCLLGVATPSDLIQDTRTTPFNIGRRIELTDFTEAEAAPLAAGLARGTPLPAPPTAHLLLQRILYWTGGHPYLTQRLCQATAEAVAQDPNPQSKIQNPQSEVDRLCEALFLSLQAQGQDDNLLFVRERLVKSEVDRAALLDLYAQVRRGKRVLPDDTNQVVSVLRLSGITRIENGALRVRNRIYERVFDPAWVTTHMPDAELRRQRAAYRRGLLRATAGAAVIVAVVAGLALVAVRQAHRADQQRRLALARELTARRYLYAADLKLAQQAWEVGNIRHAQELLDGQRPAPGMEGGDLRGFPWRLLWRLSQDQSRSTLRPDTGALFSLALSPDGTMLAVGGEGAIKLWSTASGREIATLKGHTRSVVYLAFTPDRKILVSGNLDPNAGIWDVSLWNVDARRELITFKSRSQTGDQSFSLALSPDGKTLAMGGRDRRITLWDVAARRERGTLPIRKGEVPSIRFSPDSKILARIDSPIELWDVATKRIAARLDERDTTAIAFSPDGKTLAAGHLGGGIKLWNVGARRVEAIFPGHQAGVESLAFSPDGKTLASASDDSTVKLWDVAARREIRTFKGHAGQVTAVVFSPDGKTLASASGDQTVKLWSVAAGQEVESFPGFEQSVWCVALSPDGKTLAAGCMDKTVRLWDVTTRRPLATLKGHAKAHWFGVTAVAFSPDGKLLASGGLNEAVKLWDVASRREVATLNGFHGFPGSIAFSPDGMILAAGSKGGIVKLWDLATRREIGRFKAQKENINGLGFSANGRLLASGGSGDPTVKLWDVASRKMIAAFTKEPRDSIWNVALSPDGKLLVSGSDNGTMRFWDVTTGRAVTSKGHSAAVESVVFSPDGKTLASGSDDSTVRLWDVATKREVATLKGNTGPVHSVAFSPDGSLLASGSFGSAVRIWRAPTLAEIDGAAVALPRRASP